MPVIPTRVVHYLREHGRSVCSHSGIGAQMTSDAAAVTCRRCLAAMKKSERQMSQRSFDVRKQNRRRGGV